MIDIIGLGFFHNNVNELDLYFQILILLDNHPLKSQLDYFAQNHTFFKETYLLRT